MSRKNEIMEISGPKGGLIHKFRIEKDFQWVSEGEDIKAQFRIVRELGRGAYGTVYEALHVASGVRLAIKTVAHDQVSKDAVAALQAEIDILKKLDNKSLVVYYGTAKAGPDLWILLEYAPLGSVRDVMKRLGRPLNEAEMSAVMFNALRGLAYLHSEKVRIIHRDIKAANILLTDRGEAKIADFGVSALLEEGQNNTQNAKGTPIFMAPEVLRGEDGYSFPADVWALGITCIEVLEGDPPYIKLPLVRMMYKIMEDAPPRLQHPEKFSSLCAEFVGACLTKDPTRRPTPAQLLMHGLFSATQAALHLAATMREVVVLSPTAGATTSSVPSPATSGGEEIREATESPPASLVPAGPPPPGLPAHELFRFDGRPEAQHATAPPVKVQCMTEFPLAERSLLAVGARDGSLLLWAPDGSGQAVAHVPDAHEKEVKQLCLAQGGSADLLWSLGADSSKLWAVSEEKGLLALVGAGRRVRVKLAHTLAVPPAAPRPPPLSCQLELLTGAGHELWLGTLSNRIHIFDGTARNCAFKQTVEIAPHKDMKPAEVFVTCLCFHGGSVWVAVGPCLLRLDPHSKQVINYLEGRSKIISCLIGVGKNLWSSGHDQKIKVWEMSTGAQVAQIEQTSQVLALAYDGAVVWAACWGEPRVSWYDTQRFELVRNLEARHTDAVTSFVMLRKAHRMFTGSWDKTFVEWR